MCSKRLNESYEQYNKPGVIIEERTYGVERCRFLIKQAKFGKNGDGLNTLQPQNGNRERPRYSSKFLTLSEWVNRTEIHLEMLAALKTEKVCIDQRHRAEELASMLKPNHTKVRLMDGHGYLTLLFLMKVKDMYDDDRLNDLTIEIVDIDQRVTEYHEYFFSGCNNLICLTRDVTSFDHSVNTLVYMNFCGITNSMEKVETYIRELMNQEELLISFSTGRAAAQKKDTYVGYIDKALPLGSTRIELKTERKEFVTYRLVCYKAIADKNRLIELWKEHWKGKGKSNVKFWKERNVAVSNSSFNKWVNGTTKDSHHSEKAVQDWLIEKHHL